MKYVDFGLAEYQPLWQAMQARCQRPEAPPDALWWVEHPPLYTLGVSAKEDDFLRDNGLPRLRVDRGGQVTYHGPGQWVIYPLLYLPRRHLNVQRLVFLLEQAVIDWLTAQHIKAFRQSAAPGVYTQRGKIAALGLRVRRGGCAYHGLSVNVDMDLSPFAAIRPCGRLQPVTQWRDFAPTWNKNFAKQQLMQKISQALASKKPDSDQVIE